MKSFTSKSARLRLQCIAAILLLQVNPAFAAEPPQAQSAPADSQTAQPGAEAPIPDASMPAAPAPAAAAPAANGAATPPPTLAQQMQQAEMNATIPQRPFHVELPHSHNPLAPYRPSDAPPIDLTNSPRLENLIRDGKLYISLHDAIALAIENNLDLAYFRYNFPIA